MDAQTAETVADARWFPFRYDPDTDVMHFAWMTAETHRAQTFLSDARPTEIRSIPQSSIRETATQSPLHFILHSGLGGSTLLARALGQQGVVTTLKEPPILTDVVAFGLQASAEETRQLLTLISSLMSRPFGTGEAVVCKMSSVGNGLGADIAEMRPDTRILCLQTPLDRFLASLASKGEQGRTGARRLLVGLQNSHMTCVTIPEAELGDYPDLALAALAWLSIQKLMIDAAQRLGAERVRSLGSETLLTDPAASLQAVADHFRIGLDVEARVAAGVFDRHAKTGQPFDEAQRKASFQQTLTAHGAEIEEIIEWAHKVAQAQNIAWDLPYTLFD
jgi:hypothetical protein